MEPLTSDMIIYWQVCLGVAILVLLTSHYAVIYSEQWRIDCERHLLDRPIRGSQSFCHDSDIVHVMMKSGSLNGREIPPPVQYAKPWTGFILHAGSLDNFCWQTRSLETAM